LYLSKVNAGEMQRSFKEGTLYNVVKVRTCHSNLPISIVTFGNSIPSDLCIVNSNTILSGILVQLPLYIGGIVTKL